jgi:hypothetical protein
MNEVETTFAQRAALATRRTRGGNNNTNAIEAEELLGLAPMGKWLAALGPEIRDRLDASLSRAVIASANFEAAADLITDLALERVTGQPAESTFQGNADTERGLALEPDALSAYEARTGLLLTRVGFVYRTDLAVGCSPDGAVMDGDTFVSGVETKVPKSRTHLAYLRDPAKLVAAYEAQVATTLLVTGAAFWDLCSFHPRLKSPANLLIVRLFPKKASVQSVPDPVLYDVDLAAHELNVRQFLREVDAEEAAVSDGPTDPGEDRVAVGPGLLVLDGDSLESRFELRRLTLGGRRPGHGSVLGRQA